MLTKLVIFKEKLKSIYAKGGAYIRYLLNFILAFSPMYIVTRAIGNGKLISSPVICVALALICAFLPINVTVVVATIYIIIHLFSISIELAIIAVSVITVIYLLYFRFAPKTGFLIILTPILFYIHIPYLVPVVAALTVGMTGIVPTVCGVFIYYLVNFASQYGKTLGTFSADNALQNINFIFNNILTNKELVVVVVSFAVVITMIYLIKRLSVNFSWIIAIIAGCVTDALIQIVAFSVLAVKFNVLTMVLGHLLAIVVGLVMTFFIFTVDYYATEYVQFEDDDYYYYVKAIPKLSVTSGEVKVKTINSIDETKGVMYTESPDNAEDDNDDEDNEEEKE